MIKWVANLLTFACHTILRSMSDSLSPLFWNNENKEISQKTNSYLVDLSFSLLDQINKHPQKTEQANLVTKKEEITGQINSILA